MLIGTVRGSVVAPTRHPGLVGTKLLLVDIDEAAAPRRLVAVDTVGAGVGDIVLVATGSHAVGRVGPAVPTDAVIVGITENSLIPPMN